MTTWILVADASHAKIFQTDLKAFKRGKDKLALLKNIEHVDSRKKDRDLVTDNLGKNHSDSYAEDSDPKKNEADIFAREIVKELDNARLQKRCAQMILVVPPSFYGLINKHMHPPLQACIAHVIEKDYVNEHEKTLEAHLLKHL